MKNLKLRSKNNSAPGYIQMGIYFVLAMLFSPVLNRIVVLYIGGLGYFGLLCLITLLCFIQMNMNGLKQVLLELPQLLCFLFWACYLLFIDIVVAPGKYSAFNLFGVSISVNSSGLIQLICFFIIYLYINGTNDARFIRRIGFFVLGCLVISAVLGWKALIKDPNITRELATGVHYTNIFSADYGTVNSIVMIFPVIFGMGFQSKNKSKLLYIIITVIFALFILKTSLFTSLLCLFIGAAVFFIMQLKGAYRYAILGLLAIYLLFFFNAKPIVDGMSAFADFVGNYELKQRITAISDEMMYGKSSSATMDRLDLYQQSLDGFLEAPIFGKYITEPNWSASGHSQFLDMLGGIGLFGTLPFFMFLYYLFKQLYYRGSGTMQRSITTACFAVFVYFSFVNPWLTSPAIFVSILFVCNYSIINDKQVKLRQL